MYRIVNKNLQNSYYKLLFNKRVQLQFPVHRYVVKKMSTYEYRFCHTIQPFPLQPFLGFLSASRYNPAQIRIAICIMLIAKYRFFRLLHRKI